MTNIGAVSKKIESPLTGLDCCSWVSPPVSLFDKKKILPIHSAQVTFYRREYTTPNIAKGKCNINYAVEAQQ